MLLTIRSTIARHSGHGSPCRRGAQVAHATTCMLVPCSNPAVRRPERHTTQRELSSSSSSTASLAARGAAQVGGSGGAEGLGAAAGAGRAAPETPRERRMASARSASSCASGDATVAGDGGGGAGAARGGGAGAARVGAAGGGDGKEAAQGSVGGVLCRLRASASGASTGCGGVSVRLRRASPTRGTRGGARFMHACTSLAHASFVAIVASEKANTRCAAPGAACATTRATAPSALSDALSTSQQVAGAPSLRDLNTRNWCLHSRPCGVLR